MKPAPLLSDLLVDQRKKLDLTQGDLASRLGIKRRRVSGFECRTRTPKPEELEALRRHLRISDSELRWAVADIPCDPELRQKFRHASRRLLVKQDRVSSKRYWHARQKWPRLVSEMERTLGKRQDADALRVYLRDTRYDSKLEYLAHLQMLDAGAVAGRFSPQLSGYCKLPVVDPETRLVTGHEKYPALGFRKMLFIPQVTLLTRLGPFTVDFLWGRDRHHWAAVEFDGRGHDGERDFERDEALKMRVFRFPESKVVSGAFLEELR